MSKRFLCGRFVRGFCFFTLINYSDSLPLVWYPLKTTIRVASALCAQAGSMSRQLQQLQTQLEQRSFVSERRVSESIIGLYLMPCPWWLCYILYDMFNYSIHWNLFFHIHTSKTFQDHPGCELVHVQGHDGCIVFSCWDTTKPTSRRIEGILLMFAVGRAGCWLIMIYPDLSWSIMISWGPG